MKTIFTILFALSISVTFAQTNEGYEADPFGNPYENKELTDDISYDWNWKSGIPTAPPPPPTPVPIDGGLGLLLIAGLGYAWKRVGGKHL